MHEGTFPAVPAPLALEVYDGDVDAMRADYRRHHRVLRPWLLAVGIAALGLAAVKGAGHVGDWWFWTLMGAFYVVSSTRAGADFPPAVRPTGLHFTSDGLDLDVAFEKNPRRRYSWREIRRIDDIGEVFVLVPTFGRRVVLPKRSFPDGGREAWAFIAEHGVTGARRAG